MMTLDSLFVSQLHTVRHQPGSGLFVVFDNTGKSTVESFLSAYKDDPVIKGYEALLARVSSKKPIFAKITQGARQDSIVKLNPARFRICSADMKYLQVLNSYKEGNLISTRLKTISHFGTRNAIMFSLGFLMHVEIDDFSKHELEFDNRKSVKPNYTEFETMELLPWYDGPTVYKFTKAPKKTKEEKKALEAAKLFAHAPIDCFGHELAIGDMFIHGRANDLVFGILERVTPTGVIFYRSIFGGEGKLMSTDLIISVKNDKPIHSLMKFSKGEVLSDRLVMEKLIGNKP